MSIVQLDVASHLLTIPLDFDERHRLFLQLCAEKKGALIPVDLEQLDRGHLESTELKNAQRKKFGSKDPSSRDHPSSDEIRAKMCLVSLPSWDLHEMLPGAVEFEFASLSVLSKNRESFRLENTNLKTIEERLELLLLPTCQDR